MADIIKYVPLPGLGYNDQLTRDYINAQDAKSIKSIAISADGTTLYFYKVETPTQDSIPAFEWESPTPNMEAFMTKVMGAVAGNIVQLTAAGQVVDAGIAINDLAQKAWVNTAILEQISNATHMKKELVTVVPDAASADANTFYLLKIEGTTGKDTYEVWTLIGDQMVLIDDTSVDLSGYVDNTTFQEALAAIKEEAIAEAVAQAAIDAQAKATQALNDAKQYTDTQIGTLNTKVNAIDNTVTAIQSSIVTINNTLSTQSDRITAVESSVGNIQTATNEEILAAFNSVYYPS